MDWTRLVFETLPALMGFFLATYVTLRMYERRAQFFRVARSIILVLSVCALYVLFGSELVAATYSGTFREVNEVVGVLFVVFTIWLSTLLVSLATLYPKVSSIGDLASWCRKNPLNFVTMWGVVGLVVTLSWVLGSLYNGGPLSSNHWILIPVGVYLFASITFDVSMPMLATRQGKLKPLSREGKFNMMLLAIAWTGIPAVEFLLDLVPGMGLGFGGSRPHLWLILALLAILSRSIHSAGFLGLVVTPEAEVFERDGFRPYDIPRGVYLICDSKPDAAFSLFSELSTLPLRPDAEMPSAEESARATLEFLIPNGLVVTREFPDNVRQERNLLVTPIIWLTESPGERRIAPTSLAVLTDTITRFMEANPNSIVLLEGVEYLATHNDFKKVLKSLDSMSETTWVSRGRLIVAVDANAFDEKDRALLERDKTVVLGSEGIEELKRESMVSAAFE